MFDDTRAFFITEAQEVAQLVYEFRKAQDEERIYTFCEISNNVSPNDHHINQPLMQSWVVVPCNLFSKAGEITA